MKILIVSQYFYPENFRVNDFSFSLASRGHDVTIITGLPNYPKGRLFGRYKVFRTEVKDGVKIVRVPLIPRFSSKGWQLAINYLSFLFSSVIFGLFLLRSKKFDIVFTASYSPATVGITGIFFSKIKKSKMILWVQDLWPQSLEATGAIRSKSIIRFFKLMVTWIYKRCDLILIQSEAFSHQIIKLGIDNDKIELFPNWAEDLYKKKHIKNQKKFNSLIPDNKFIIMFAGNLGKAQSLETIVHAANLTKDFNIHWIILFNNF